MKHKNNIDIFYYMTVNLYAIICLVMCTLTISLNANTLYTILAILCMIFIGVILLLFYKRSYEFLDNTFIINIGPFKKEYNYKDIKKCVIVNNISISYATSIKKILIEFFDGKKIYISPEKMDLVLSKLINKKGTNK